MYYNDSAGRRKRTASGQPATPGRGQAQLAWGWGLWYHRPDLPHATSGTAMSARLTAALLAGRAATGLSRRLGLGGGTVISGHLVPRIAPNALSTIVDRLTHGSVVVSGTNGKTTTTRLLAHLLRTNGLRPLNNRAGANLLTGLVSAVVQQTNLKGEPEADVGLFEVDEATLPAAIRLVQPRLVLLTNIFRDQLDRYGEVHFIHQTWTAGLTSLHDEARLVLNADDPLVASLGLENSDAIYYGVNDPSLGVSTSPHAADARLCIRCGERYVVSVSFYGHLGHYQCPACGLRRPEPQVALTACTLQGDRGSEIQIDTPQGTIKAHVKLPGLYNVYNALAATTAALELGIAPAAIAQGIETFAAAFGRLERISIEGRQLFLALVKNPVGFTEVLRTINPESAGANLAIFINDHFADGTDVSWLWDVDFELLRDKINFAICSGTRAEDMAVRLKYADISTRKIVVISEPRRALDEALARSDPNDTVFALPTYTAMLEVRDVLRRTGYVRHFYED
jgi:lipid II isoglutaminyl synthase (glutamine-hydrolysing)